MFHSPKTQKKLLHNSKPIAAFEAFQRGERRTSHNLKTYFKTFSNGKKRKTWTKKSQRTRCFWSHMTKQNIQHNFTSQWAPARLWLPSRAGLLSIGSLPQTTSCFVGQKYRVPKKPIGFDVFWGFYLKKTIGNGEKWLTQSPVVLKVFLFDP